MRTQEERLGAIADLVYLLLAAFDTLLIAALDPEWFTFVGAENYTRAVASLDNDFGGTGFALCQLDVFKGNPGSGFSALVVLDGLTQELCASVVITITNNKENKMAYIRSATGIGLPAQLDRRCRARD